MATTTAAVGSVASPDPGPGAPSTLSDLRQLRVAFLFQVRSYLQTWRFIGLLIFVVLISSAILAVQFSRPDGYITTTYPSASAYLGGYLGYANDAIVITAAFLGGDALAVDLGGGPGYLMLTQPVRRVTLLLGRYLAAALVGLAIAAVYYLFAVVAVFHFYNTVPGALAVSFGCAFFFGLAALAVAFFFSSFFRSPAVSIVASLLILILAFPILTAIGTLTGTEPWYSLDYGSEIVTNVLSANFAHKTVMSVPIRHGASLTFTTWSPYLWEGLVILAVYLVGFLVACYLLYQYKEVRA